MIFGFWKKRPAPLQRSKPLRSRSTVRYGGMQERELQARLELLLDPVLTRHRSVLEPARALAEFSLVEQQRFLASIDRVSLHEPELAFHFCQLAIPALAELDDTAWEPWIDGLQETFRDKGLESCVHNIEAFQSFQQQQAPASGSIAFTDIAGVLNSYMRALSGRDLKLSSAEQSYTDTETLFLPAHISHYPTRHENFRLYKALLVHQWAQTWFGTWRLDIVDALKDFSDPERALQLFHRLETLRLDACLERELPGVARDMTMLRSTDPLHPRWQEAQAELSDPDADIHTSLTWLTLLFPLDIDPQPALYQGHIYAEKTSAVIAERGERERQALQDKLSRLQQTLTNQDDPAADSQAGFNVVPAVTSQSSGESRTSLEYRETAVNIEPELQALLDSITQDHGDVPEYYLHNINAGDASGEHEPDQSPENTGKQNTHDFSYDEWDHARQRYRKNWCLLHEQTVAPVNGDFIDATLSKYRGLLVQLRRTFEALRQENRRLRREPFGDDIDIDAIVEAWGDTHHGLEASERLFIQTSRQERQVAVMFMIDMSASTAGWINQVERESLVLLCEALEQLDDQYAIYGFSGRGNRDCQCYHIKNFDESYNNEVRGRIEGIQPQDCTRLGAAIRHLATKLNQVEARTRLLITLSDGRPDDIDGYLGPYGIEDTRKALIETRHTGIHPYCITIDTDAREYLPHMYGDTNFIIIDQVKKLPQRIADIYRSLTT
jgi:nitric oxide reductase NorD protein